MHIKNLKWLPVFCIGISTFLISACGGSQSSDNKTSDSTQLAEKNLNQCDWCKYSKFGDLYLGMPLDEAKKILGEPDSEKKDDAFSSMEFKTKGISLNYFTNSGNNKVEVCRIELSGNCRLKNSKGIGIGSTVEEILSVCPSEFLDSKDGTYTVCNGMPWYTITIKDGKIDDITITTAFD